MIDSQFEKRFNQQTFILVSIGIISAWVADPTPLAVVMALVTTPLVLSSYYFTEHRKSFYLSTLVASGLATIAFFVALGAVLSWLSVLLPFLHFLSFAQCMRLWQKKGKRDYSSLYIVSLIQIACGASISLDIQFGVMFFLYMFLAFWTLIMFYIREAAPEGTGVVFCGRTQPLSRLTSRDAKGALGRSLTFMMLFLVVGMFAVFLILPRFQLRMFGGPSQAVQKKGMTGFGERIRLGQIGEILDSDELVMRVKITRDGKPAALDESQLYWRGMSADSYVHGTWRETRQPNYSIFHLKGEEGWLARDEWILKDNALYSWQGEKFPTLPNTVELEQGDIKQEISIEDIGSKRAFCLHPPVQIDTGEQSEGVRLDVQHWNLSFVKSVPRYYVVYSRPANHSKEVLNRPLIAGQKLPALMRTYFVKSPPTPPRLKELAEQIAADANADTFFEKATATRNWLTLNCEYTRLPGVIDNPRQVDPVMNFLTKTRSGHCEYFASAHVLLCRALGVPARIVNGFRGGEWNEVGEFYQVRQRHAHSWVEVYLPGTGWYRMDPSGIDRVPDSRDSSTGLAQYFDWSQNLWDRFIIGYTPKRFGLYTTSFLENKAYDLQSQVRSLGSGGGLEGIESIQSFFGKLAFAIAGGAALYLLFGLLSKLGAFRRTKEVAVAGLNALAPAIGFYQDFLLFFQERGFTRKGSETPAEFVDSLPLSGTAVPKVNRLTEIYYDARFSGRGVDAKLENEARGIIDSVRREFPEEK